jgi:hypothetical protein
LQSELVEIEVNACNFSALHLLWHTLGRSGSFDRIAADQHSLFAGLSVSLQNVNILDWVLNLALSISHLYIGHSVDDHVGEEVSFTVK